MPSTEGSQPSQRARATSIAGQGSLSLPREHPPLLLSALRESFSTTYLTLMSIIQGATLGYLVVVVDEGLAVFTTATWLMVATTFLIIVAVWHEYMIAVTTFTWIAGLRDSLIPFLFGGSEMMLIRSLRRPSELEWTFLAAAFVAIVALIAFINMYRSAATEEDLNNDLLVAVRFYRWLNLVFVGLASLILISFSVLEAQGDLSVATDIALSACALGLMLAFFTRGYFYWNRVIEIAKQRAGALS
jgi:hypothetical protein